MTNFDISDIEAAFKAIVKNAGVSAVIYTNRPKAKTSDEDFVVVSVSGNVRDVAGYGETKVGIDLFARDVMNIKNAVKLGLMYDALVANMPAEYGRYLIDPNPNIIADAPDDYGFHARMIEFQITIKNE